MSREKKLSDAAAEVNKAAGDNFERLVGELQRDIPRIAVDFHEVLMKIDVLEAEKKNSKIKYQRSLDEGNEETMALCLKGIREKNVLIQKLKAELARFPEEVKKLYERKERISGLAQADQVAAAVKVREAEKLLKEAERRVRRCYGLMSQVNELNMSVQDIIRGFEKEKKTSEAEIKTPRSNKDGFWLEVDDPVAAGTLRHYRRLKEDDGLELPFMLNFKDKEKSPVDEARLKTEFEKSETLKSEFGDLKSYLDFKGKIIVQVLELYIVRANGGGDRLRGFAGQFALDKCR